MVDIKSKITNIMNRETQIADVSLPEAPTTKAGKGLTATEMNSLFEDFKSVKQDPKHNQELLNWVGQNHPALYYAVMNYDNSKDAFELGYVAQTQGSLENTTVPEGADKHAIAQKAADVANDYAKQCGYEGVILEDNKFILKYTDKQYRILDVDKATGGVLGFFKASKSADNLARELCTQINKGHYGENIALPPNFKIDPWDKPFSAINSLWAGAAANLTYLSPTEVEPVIQSWGFDKLSFIEDIKTDTELHVASNKDLIVVPFRGTEINWDDIKTDLDTTPVREEGNIIHGNVPRGVQTALDSVWDELLKQVNEARDNGQKIVLSGHSLGGALATVAAGRLIEYGIDPKDIKLYTYGQPCVGDKEYMDSLNAALKGNYYRFVNNNDVVPMVLNSEVSSKSGQKYVHGGDLYYYNADGQLLKNPKEYVKTYLDTWKTTDGIKGRINSESVKAGFTNALNDHLMGNYIGLGKTNMHVDNPVSSPEQVK